MNKVIRLNENKLKQLISESVNKVLNEIGYRGAALAHGANYNAKIDYRQNSNVNARSKMAKSETITAERKARISFSARGRSLL